MSINPNIFKAYDIRGKYPEEFDEDAAYKIARASALFLGAKRIAVAMDNRYSSESLKKTVIDGLLAEGIEIVDCGVSTTPMFYFAVNSQNTDGGIMITASHNPPQYNGLKITEKNAKPIGQDSGLLEIKEIALNRDFERSDPPKGNIIENGHLCAYADFLVQGRKFPAARVVVDVGCGPAGEIIREVSERAGIEISELCFPPCATLAHEANPLKDENVIDLQKAIIEKNADFGVAFDGDGDRVFFFDSKGERIPTYAVASLLASEFLKENKGVAVISDVRMPKAFTETIQASGGKVVRSRVGHAFIKKLLRENDAIFGAEVSGHYYFRDFFGVDSGMYAFVKVMDIMAKSDKSLVYLTKPFLARFQSGELDFKVADKETAILKLENIFADGKISKLDGLTVEYKDWWFNVRPSNTEPLLRVNIEAETAEKLSETKESIEKILNFN